MREVQQQGESARYEPGSPPAEPRRLNKVQHPLSQPIVTSGCKRCDRMTSSMVGWWSHQVLLISFNTMHSGPVALLVKPAWSASPVLTSLPPYTDEDNTVVTYFEWGLGDRQVLWLEWALV